MKRVTPVVAMLVCSLSRLAQSTDGIQNWTAPPYWARTQAASQTGGESGGRDAVASSRQVLAGGPVALPFVTLPPCRLVDTRAPLFPAPLGGGSLSPATTRNYTLVGVCGVPANAQAISLNATVTNTAGPGFLVLWRKGDALPPVSTLTFIAGETLANAAVVPLSADGSISVAFGVSGGDIILDTNGYYAPAPSVTSLNTMTGDVTLAAGANVSITPSANTLTIAAIASGGGPPSGPAGGGLTGTYPNPGIAPAAVGAAQLANNTAVRSINGAAQDMVTLQGSGDVTVSTTGSTVTIGPPSGSMVLGAPGDTTLIGAGYTEIARTSIDYWTGTAATNAPAERYWHTAIWTGSRMIVWGGIRDIYGAFYLNDGGQYDPVANAWTATTTTGAPSPRAYHTAVWTGSKMIVWGGFDRYSPLNDGGQYDPVANTWTATTNVNAPSWRLGHTALWTGSKMIVWGGGIGGSPLNSGGQYDPVADSWTATTTSGAPSERVAHTAVWTGSKMIVWGGGTWVFNQILGDGGQYDPVANTWTQTAAAGAPSARQNHTAVWTGSKMIVWGGSNDAFDFGNLNDGGQYDPVANTWTVTSTTNAPSKRGYQTAVWTGTRMIVWGGDGSGVLLGDGGQYEPMANSWTPTQTIGSPSARFYHTAIWTGSKMIVWGGTDGPVVLSNGGQWGTVSLYRKN